ncbi:MAG: hypothetical protein AAF267_05695 [Deinococcota bacterium]
MRNVALYLAGSLAIFTAIYHGIVGDRMLQLLEITPEELAFVRATYQLGSVGWLAGGVLLIAAGRLQSAAARNWIVGVFAVVYGFPAVGNFVLVGGRPSFGWLALASIVVLALVGRPMSPIDSMNKMTY